MQQKKYDYIFDTVGKSSFSSCKRLLKSNGVYLITTGKILPLLFNNLWTKLFSNKKHIHGMSIEKKENIKVLKELVEVGAIRPVIDRYYTLENIAEAHYYVEKGHKVGNVVIKV